MTPVECRFHGGVKIHTENTEAYKDVRIAANVDTDADVTLSTGSPEILLPQRNQPAQRLCIDLSETSKTGAAKFPSAKLCSSRSGASVDSS